MAVRWEIILKFMDEKILILYKFFQKITRSKIFPIPFIRSLALISKQRQDKKRKEENCKPISLMNIDNEKP